MSMVQWHILLNDYFGLKLDRDDAYRWWGELKDTVSNLEESELCEAIRQASYNDRNVKLGKPKLKDLRVWVYMHRSGERGPTIGAKLGTDEAYLNRLKCEIRNAKGDQRRIWNLICDPMNVLDDCKRDTTVEECQILERFAMETDGFERPHIESFAAHLAAIEGGMRV